MINKLSIGSKIKWLVYIKNPTPFVIGTVTDINYDGIFILWNDSIEIKRYANYTIDYWIETGKIILDSVIDKDLICKKIK